MALHLGTALALALSERRHAALGAAGRRRRRRRRSPAWRSSGVDRGAARDAADGRRRPARGRGGDGRSPTARRRGAARSTPARPTAPGSALAQAAALIPGVSRSGATRAAARARGFGRADAAELSREVALPVLAGAAALKGFRLARRRPPASDAAHARGRRRGRGAVSTGGALRAERALAADAPLAGWAAYRVAVAAAILVGWRRDIAGADRASA